MLISVKLLTKYRGYNNLCIRFGTRNVWCLNQGCSKVDLFVEIPGWAWRKEWLSHSKLKQAFLIDSDTELFMSLIQCFGFGSRSLASEPDLRRPLLK